MFYVPKKILVATALCLLIVSCKKSEDSVTVLADNLLVLQTEQAEDITGNGALGKGNIKVNGSPSVTALGVCWSTSPNPTISYYSNIYTGSSYSSFSCPITGLSPGTTYYVRSYATVNRLSGNVGSFTAYGNQIQFTTSAAELPTISTKAVSSITGTGASSGGVISNDGGKTITAKGVCWSTSSNPTIALSTKTSNGTGTGSFTSTITGLSPGTTYYVRGYASNSSGTGYGEELSFSSLSNGLPSISTTVVSSITTSTATSGGNITNSGSSAVTSRGVVWSTSQNPTIALSTKTTNGTGTGSFISSLTGLSSGTTYYMRAYATNSSGTAYGANETFTTVSIGLPTIATRVVSSVTCTSAASGGNFSSNGGEAVTSRGVCWSTGPNPTIALSTKTNNGTGNGNFISNITGLISGTTYYVRAYATTSAGTVYGANEIFTTVSIGLPSLTTLSVFSVSTSSTSATSGGNISNNGCAAVISSGVCWSTGPNPTISLSTKTNDGTVNGTFTSTITGLSPGTTYYVRAYATNSSGTAYGNQENFTTTPAALTVTDVDGNVYQTVAIGSQVWMKENLKVTKYRNGNPIPTNLSNTSWFSTSIGAYALISAGCGNLYNWYALNDSRGLCPTGWHTPTDAEWTTLEDFLGGSSLAGGKMKSISMNWQAPNQGATNESGFTGLPCGQRYDYDGNYADFGTAGWWFSSTVSSGDRIWCRALSAFHGNLTRVDYQRKTSGLSIRCVKN